MAFEGSLCSTAKNLQTGDLVLDEKRVMRVDVDMRVDVVENDVGGDGSVVIFVAVDFVEV